MGLSAHVTSTTEDMPYVFRVTDVNGEDVQVEVGERFKPLPAWADEEDAYLKQVGLRLVMLGLRFLGHSTDSAKMIATLAMKTMR